MLSRANEKEKSDIDVGQQTASKNGEGKKLAVFVVKDVLLHYIQE